MARDSTHQHGRMQSFSSNTDPRVIISNFPRDDHCSFSVVALRNEMILPRSPSPALSVDGLGREEVERLARERLAEIKVRKTRLLSPR